MRHASPEGICCATTVFGFRCIQFGCVNEGPVHTCFWFGVMGGTKDYCLSVFLSLLSVYILHNSWTIISPQFLFYYFKLIRIQTTIKIIERFNFT